MIIGTVFVWVERSGNLEETRQKRQNGGSAVDGNICCEWRMKEERGNTLPLRVELACNKSTQCQWVGKERKRSGFDRLLNFASLAGYQKKK